MRTMPRARTNRPPARALSSARARALTAGARACTRRPAPITTVRIKRTGRGPPRPPGWCLHGNYRAVWLGDDPPPRFGASGHSACAFEPERWSVSWQPVRCPRCCLSVALCVVVICCCTRLYSVYVDVSTICGRGGWSVEGRFAPGSGD